jgi:hypothetical protein
MFAGKSFLLRRIIDALPKETTFATSTTGVAATNINATTIQSFTGTANSVSLQHFGVFMMSGLNKKAIPFCQPSILSSSAAHLLIVNARSRVWHAKSTTLATGIVLKKHAISWTQRVTWLT